MSHSPMIIEVCNEMVTVGYLHHVISDLAACDRHRAGERSDNVAVTNDADGRGAVARLHNAWTQSEGVHSARVSVQASVRPAA